VKTTNLVSLIADNAHRDIRIMNQLLS